MAGIMEFLIPDIRRARQATAFDNTAKNIGNQLGQDFDNQGQPVEGPQRPGRVEPNEYNMNDLSMAHQLLYSGNTEMQQKGMDIVNKVTGSQTQSNIIGDAINQGGELSDQLSMIATNSPENAQWAFANKRALATAKPPEIKGPWGDYVAYAKGNKEEPTREGFLKFLEDTGKLNEPLTPVYDPTSPTLYRHQPRSKAAGEPAKAPSSTKLTIDPKTGEISFEQGTGLTTKPTTTDVEKRILDSGETMAQLKSIEGKFKPEFQQVGTRWDALTTAWKNKMAWDVSPQERQLLDEFTSYRADAAQMFSLTLKDLSGVAVNPTEFKRAEKWLPYPGTGLFDGDSPIELQSKVKRFKDFTKRALAKYAYIKRNGLSTKDVDVDDMPKIIRERGEEIAAVYKKNGVRGKELVRQVKAQLAEEFGIISE